MRLRKRVLTTPPSSPWVGPVKTVNTAEKSIMIMDSLATVKYGITYTLKLRQ